MSKTRLEKLEAAAREQAKADAVRVAEEARLRRARAAWRERVVANEEALLATQAAFAEEVARVEPLFRALRGSDEWSRLEAVTQTLFRRPPRLPGPPLVCVRGVYAAGSLSRGDGNEVEWTIGPSIDLNRIHYAKFYGRRAIRVASFPSFAALADVPAVVDWDADALGGNAADLDRLRALVGARWLVQQVADGRLYGLAEQAAERANRPVRLVGF